MKTRKPTPTLRAIALRAGALLLALWLASMGALTLCLAQYLFSSLAQSGLDYPEYAIMVSRMEEDWFQEYPDVPGKAE